MFKIWDASNFRRTVAGLCLIAAPVAFAIAELLYQFLPGGGDDPIALLSSTSGQHGLWAAGITAGIVSAILFIPAVFGMTQVIRGRGVVLAHVGGGLTLIGNALSGLVLAGLQLVTYVMASPGLDRHAMVAALQAGMQSPALAPIVAGHYLFAIGLLLLGLAAWRARLAGRWAGLAVVAAVLCDAVVGSFADGLAVTVISDALLIAGLGAIGVRLLIGPDAFWERTPEPERAPATGPAVALSE